MELRPDLVSQPEDLRRMMEFNLDSQDMEHVRFLVYSPAWREFFEPLLHSLEGYSMSQLVDPSQERKWARSDDSLRGAIYTIRAILNFPHQRLAEADADAEEANRSAQEAAEYERRGRVGHYSPYGTTPGGNDATSTW